MPIGSTLTMKKLFLCMCVVVLAGCTGTPREVRLTDLRTTINQRDERRLPLDFAKIQMALFKHEKACGSSPVFAVNPGHPSYATITLKAYPGAGWGDTVLVDLTLLANLTVKAEAYTYRPGQEALINQVFNAISHPGTCPKP